MKMCFETFCKDRSLGGSDKGKSSGIVKTRLFSLAVPVLFGETERD